MTIFILGLFKKLVIADGVAMHYTLRQQDGQRYGFAKNGYDARTSMKGEQMRYFIWEESDYQANNWFTPPLKGSVLSIQEAK